MRKCPYCGKDYPDDVARCPIDDQPLLGGDFPPPPAKEQNFERPVPPLLSEATSARTLLTDRQIRIIELVLVCVIAFGGAILVSTYSFLGNSYGSLYYASNWPKWSWVIKMVREGSALGLVWYILMRRGKSFSDLGLKWGWKNVGWSILLYLAACFAFSMVYKASYFFGLTSMSSNALSTRVEHIVFGGGVPLSAVLFQFLNPFFEELIVRAYVMTEVKQLTNSVSKAVVASTLLQTSYHFYQGGAAAFAHAAGFLIWSIYYAKTNRIAPVILAHLYTDVNGTLWAMFAR